MLTLADIEALVIHYMIYIHTLSLIQKCTMINGLPAPVQLQTLIYKSSLFKQALKHKDHTRNKEI